MKCLYLVTVLAILSAAPCWAQTEQFGSFYVFGDGGPSTYSSQLVESNDTSYGYRYGFKALAGENKNLLFSLVNHANSTAFLLNESSLQQSWQDTLLGYQWGFGYAGLVLTSMTMTAVGAGAGELFDASGRGYGVAGGLHLPFAKRALLALDFSYAQVMQVVEPTQVAVTYGPRMIVDGYVSYGITRQMLSILLGYRMQSLGINLDGDASTDWLTTSYLGLLATFYW